MDSPGICLQVEDKRAMPGEDHTVKFTIRDKDIGQKVYKFIGKFFRDNPGYLFELVVLMFEFCLLAAKKSNSHTCNPGSGILPIITLIIWSLFFDIIIRLPVPAYLTSGGTNQKQGLEVVVWRHGDVALLLPDTRTRNARNNREMCASGIPVTFQTNIRETSAGRYY